MVEEGRRGRRAGVRAGADGGGGGRRRGEGGRRGGGPARARAAEAAGRRAGPGDGSVRVDGGARGIEREECGV